MKILPLAFDSLGTRSMATFVETDSCKILIDPGVALGPSRYGLPPHPFEFERLNEHWETIKEFSKKADVLIVTHYHYDHHDPSEPKLYDNKTVLIKHPTEKINRSQKERAKFFLEQIKALPKALGFADGNEFKFGDTTVKFSRPVCHGTNSRLGYVVEVSISDNDSKLVHTSDVEGPSLDEQVSFILSEKPDIVICDGPMTYMLGYKYSMQSLQESIKNIINIMETIDVEKFVLDHHLLRDIKWRERLDDVFKGAERKGTEILTAAELAGKENELLEARRKLLYGES